MKKPTRITFVNRFTAYLLGVYLFTGVTVPGYMNVQQYIFKKAGWIGFIRPDALFPLRFIALSVGVFLLSVGIEYVRTVLIQKPFLRIVDRRCAGKLKKVDAFMASLTDPRSNSTLQTGG